MTSKQITLPLNATEAAEYFEVSRNTVAKAIKTHKLEPVKSKGKTHWYEARDLAPCLMRAKHTVRTDRNAFESKEIMLIESIKAKFEGDMKQFHAYQQALLTKDKRRADAGLLTEAETVVATIGAVISRIDKIFRKVPQMAESICEDFTHRHSTKLDELLAQEKRAFLKSAQELAEDAEQRLQDAD
ncbi:helix-turn-helix domain-containing protein [Vibrio aestuarianus]|uniref:helix-turn-helix domain-containing protein n=1 Tax=Vibrio aestuarianus TaxID=28171 RepID=UPI0015949096|nr:helix-turn-helix domain-containing protein [Vibrio aestuarianus]NGZ17986.1 helix-turn-helix domain-containing protein [Vibrio aestuarianus]